MSTITAILVPDADGMLRLPIPAAWRKTPIRIKAEIEPADETLTAVKPSALKGFGCLRGKISMTDDFDQPLEDFREYMT